MNIDNKYLKIAESHREFKNELKLAGYKYWDLTIYGDICKGEYPVYRVWLRYNWTLVVDVKIEGYSNHAKVLYKQSLHNSPEALRLVEDIGAIYQDCFKCYDITFYPTP